MKQFLIIVSLLCVTISATSQPGLMLPSWVKELPKAKIGSHYYYRVTMAEAPTYDKAYASAFAKALMEAKWRLGASVSFTDDIKSLEDSVTNGINVNEQSVKIPLNRVCDYWEEVRTTRARYIRLYVLWQVAENGIVQPKFDEFNDCK